jgi:ATP-dependent DNA helicase RecQ
MLDTSTAEEQHKHLERQKLDALLGWCEMTECRRRALLTYFGEEPPMRCGNCDVCVIPPKTWDATLAAQQLLSCIYRTGQRFGAAHVIDVLLGKVTDKVRQHRHTEVSTFGLGVDISAQRWRSILRQLMVGGFVTADAERFGALILTSESRPLLRGELSLQLREDPASNTSKAKSTRGPRAQISAENEGLWMALRECRARIAKDQGIPPYAVFHDSTLVEMLESRPTNLHAMRGISGVGEVKLDRYGDEFLAIISA